jgi:hypothetical protein
MLVVVRRSNARSACSLGLKPISAGALTGRSPQVEASRPAAASLSRRTTFESARVRAEETLARVGSVQAIGVAARGDADLRVSRTRAPASVTGPAEAPRSVHDRPVPRRDPRVDQAPAVSFVPSSRALHCHAQGSPSAAMGVGG